MDSVGNYLEDGDLVEFDRGDIRHWGVYDGGYIIHVTGDANISSAGCSDAALEELAAGLVGMVNAFVKREKLKDVVKGCKFYKNNQLDEKYTPFSVEEIIERATKRIGDEWNYYLLSSNCEHFASEMRYGFPISLQAWAAGTAAVAIGVGGVLATGSIMSIKSKRKT